MHRLNLSKEDTEFVEITDVNPTQYTLEDIEEEFNLEITDLDLVLLSGVWNPLYLLET